MGKAPSDYAKTWWGKSWIESVEGVSTAYANRLIHGLKFAQHHPSEGLKINGGKIEILIPGQRRNPHRVNIQLKALSNAQWNKIIEQLGERAAFTASLLAGEMPEEIADVFKQYDLPLFPKRMRDLKTSCSCPDWANPCKHIVNAHFAFAEALDTDPFLLLLLRGRTREQILTALRAVRSGEEFDEKQTGSRSSKDQQGISVTQIDPATFFKGQDNLANYRFHITPPSTPMPLLTRLGQLDRWELEVSLTRAFRHLYEYTSHFAANLGSFEQHGQKDSPQIVFEESYPPPVDDNSWDPEEYEEKYEEEEDLDDPDNITVLVRRAKNSVETPSKSQQKKKRKKKKREAPPSEPPPHSFNESLNPPRSSPAQDLFYSEELDAENEDSPRRLSRRVAPGSGDVGNPSNLETRLELILPITETERTPDGPHIARQIVWALKTHGSATARQLARRTRLKKTSVMQIIQGLLAVGVVFQEGQGERARFSVPDH